MFANIRPCPNPLSSTHSKQPQQSAVRPILLALLIGISCVVFAAFALSVTAPKAQAQSYWYIGLSPANGGCYPMGSAYACHSPDAACRSISDYYHSPYNYLSTNSMGPVCNYYYHVPYTSQVYASCDAPNVEDVTAALCVAPNTKQTGKTAGRRRPKKSAKPKPDNDPDHAKDCNCDSDGPNSSGQGSAGEPIDIGSGNVFYSHTDYETAGPNKLEFTRYYNSRSSFFASLGVNWRSNFDRHLYLFSSTSTQVQRADGQQVMFTFTGGVWVTDSDVDYTLTNSGTTWTLTDDDDTVEVYTTASNGIEAQLNSITRRGGFKETLTYDSTTGYLLSSVTDSYGRTLTFTYNSLGLLQSILTPDATTISYGLTEGTSGDNLTTVTFPTSPTQTITYVYGSSTLPNALTGVTDELSNTFQSWTYDANARGLTSYSGGTGISANLVTIAYNDTTGSRTVTNALGVTDTYSLTTLQGVAKITGISRAATTTTAAATRSFTFDSNGYLASATDWNGNSTTYTNNSHGFPTQINEAVGSSPDASRTTNIVYDTTWVRSPYSVTPPIRAYYYSYDTSGNLLSFATHDNCGCPTDGQTRYWNFTYDATGEMLTAKTPNSNTTTFTYTGGALTKITNPLSQATNITSVTGGGRPLTIVDPNSVTTTLTYDARQRLLTSAVSTSGGTLTTTLTYDAAGNLTKTTLPDSSYISRGYDLAHRLTTITDGDSNSIDLTLDALGDITQALWKDSSATTRRTRTATFDALGRMLTTTGVAGQTTTLTYDKNGNTLTSKDGLSHTTTKVFDALNRPYSITDANSGVTTIGYYQDDFPYAITDARNNTTNYSVNGFGDTIGIVSPDRGSWSFTFDADSNITQQTDGASVVTNQTFDALDRVTATTYPSDSTLNVTYGYDLSGGDYSFSIGRLSKLTDKAGYENYGYDERGNTTVQKRTNGTQHYYRYYSYDAASRLANIGYPSGLNVGYQRDSAGIVAGILYVAPGATSGTPMANVYYRPFGPAYQLSFYNGITNTFTTDQDYRVTGISDNSSIQNLTYALDNADNVSSITDSLHASNSQSFGYDVINRLTSAASGTGGYGSLVWTYDKVGNLLTKVVGTTTTTYTTPSTSNRLASWVVGGTTTTVSTNANGNITSIPSANGMGTGAFSYNAANRLSGLTGTALAATFVYDGLGHRFSKTQGGSSTYYYTYGLDDAMLEENDGGVVTDYIYLDGKPVGVIVPGSSPPTTSQLYYLHDDRLGTPQYATNSSKAVVWSAGGYQPYGTTGTVSGTITQNLRLPGQYMDVEAGFYQNGARDYMPNLGRYLESDPIGLAGGINPYLYTGANPVKMVDPNGTIPKSVGKTVRAMACILSIVTCNPPGDMGDFPEDATTSQQAATESLETDVCQVGKFTPGEPPPPAPAPAPALAPKGPAGTPPSIPLILIIPSYLMHIVLPLPDDGNGSA